MVKEQIKNLIIAERTRIIDLLIKKDVLRDNMAMPNAHVAFKTDGSEALDIFGLNRPILLPSDDPQCGCGWCLNDWDKPCNSCAEACLDCQEKFDTSEPEYTGEEIAKFEQMFAKLVLGKTIEKLDHDK